MAGRGRFAPGELGIVWAVPPEVLAENVGRYGDRVVDSLRHELDAIARAIEDYAKANHPWENQSGAAEAGLECRVFDAGGGLQVILYHTVSYGIWLEVKYAGRDGVIPIAMAANYNNIMSAMRTALGG